MHLNPVPPLEDLWFPYGFHIVDTRWLYSRLSSCLYVVVCFLSVVVHAHTSTHPTCWPQKLDVMVLCCCPPESLPYHHRPVMCYLFYMHQSEEPTSNTWHTGYENEQVNNKSTTGQPKSAFLYLIQKKISVQLTQLQGSTREYKYTHRNPISSP